jgi:hypothetical protein
MDIKATNSDDLRQFFGKRTQTAVSLLPRDFRRDKEIDLDDLLPHHNEFLFPSLQHFW